MNFYRTSFNGHIANYVLQKGDAALAGDNEEITTHYFPSDNTKNRKIFFKGYYLSIYNEQTEDYKRHIINEIPTTKYQDYDVPAGYAVYVRRATVYFQV